MDVYGPLCVQHNITVSANKNKPSNYYQPGYSAKARCSVLCSQNWHYNLKSSRQLIKIFKRNKQKCRNGSAWWKKGRNKIISVNKVYFSQLPAYISIKYIHYIFSLLQTRFFIKKNNKEVRNLFKKNICQVNMFVCLSIQLPWLLQSEHAHTCIIWCKIGTVTNKEWAHVLWTYTKGNTTRLTTDILYVCTVLDTSILCKHVDDLKNKSHQVLCV